MRPERSFKRSATVWHVNSNSHRDWILIHALAGVSALVVALVILFETYDTNGRLPGAADPLIEAIIRSLIGAVGAVAAIWLWVRMLVDYIHQRPVKHPLSWGLALFLGAYVGALVYFWRIWRPRHRSGTSTNAA